MKILFDQNNIPSPKWYFVDSNGVRNGFTGELVNTNDVRFPLVGKVKYHAKGEGMVKIDSMEELSSFIRENRGYHFEEFFNGTREYRIHCSPLLEDEIFSVRKVRTKNEDGELPWHFHLNQGAFLKDFEKPSNWNQIVQASKDAVAALGMDIGAVDVRTSRRGDRFVIIEVNSSPGMADNTESHYRDAIIKILSIKAQ